MFNLRDWGAGIWERSGRPVRVLIALGAIAAAASLPFLGGTFLNTPVADYGSVLVFPVAIFVIMALGLNIVIGKSGLLDLGYVAFFAIGAYTMGLLGTKTGLNSWEELSAYQPRRQFLDLSTPLTITDSISGLSSSSSC